MWRPPDLPSESVDEGTLAEISYAIKQKKKKENDWVTEFAYSQGGTKKSVLEVGTRTTLPNLSAQKWNIHIETFIREYLSSVEKCADHLTYQLSVW